MSDVPQPLRRCQEERPTYDLGAQGVQSTPQKPNDLEMSMHLLRSVAILDAPIDNKVSVWIEKKRDGNYILVKAYRYGCDT